MKFTELEELMSQRGIHSLAEIARTLNTTPQAVSNWKARDQVPYHIVTRLNKDLNQQSPVQPHEYSSLGKGYPLSSVLEENTISLSDILLTMAEQLKVILLVPFITIFLTFTYVQFIQKPLYESWATILLPGNQVSGMGGLAGLATQFGVNVPQEIKADLSSPTLFPELLHSRTFAEKILDKVFYTEEYGKELSLLAILTYGDKSPKLGKDTLVTNALSSLGKILEFNQDAFGSFSAIKVTASEPIFAKELAEEVLVEMEALNRFFKSKRVIEKTIFIEERIASVKNDLEESEKRLKEFREQNR